MFLTQDTAERLLANDLVIRIDPRSVTHEVGPKKPLTRPARKLFKALFPFTPGMRKRAADFLDSLHPFALSAVLYPTPRPIEENDKYRKVEDLVRNVEDYTSSRWFHSLMQDLSCRGQARHKKILMLSETDIHRFFLEYACPLIHSLQRDGYLEDLTSPGTVLIGADGEIHKAGSATHRFFIARCLGVHPVSVRVVGVHHGWLRARGINPNSDAVLQRIPSAIQALSPERHTLPPVS